MNLLSRIERAVIDGALQDCLDAVRAALKDGVGVESVLNDALVAGMSEVGRRFKEGEYFVPEVLIAARAMNGGLQILEPLLTECGVEPRGRLVIGTVKDDIHDIGKNLVGMMMKGAGFKVVDLGHDISPQSFVEAARENKTDAVLMSSLLTTTMPNMLHVITAIKEAELRDKLVIMVGGAPVSQRFADEIGADGFAPDAASAVDVLSNLLARRR
jgi:5-methyltetrahydrofolate--homocysteine methyltransferase